jgi:Bacterial Ig-like domain (group 3)
VRLRGLAAGVISATLTALALVPLATPASATSTPPWEPDGGNIGTIAFYDSSGTQVTSGSDLTHLFDFAAASAQACPTSSIKKATLTFAAPNSAQPTGAWHSGAASASTNYPVSSPAPLASNTNPVASLTASDGNLSTFLQSSSLDSTPGYANIIQLRMVCSGNGGVTSLPHYYTADIQYSLTDPVADTGTWAELWPIDATGVATSTTTSLAAQSSTVNTLTSDTLSATVTPSAAGGSVQFVDTAHGNAVLGSATVSSGGIATLAHTFSSTGTYTVVANFTPTNPSQYAASSSSPVTVTVADPAGAFAPLTPARILDTRNGTGASGALTAGHSLSLTVAGVGGVPAGFDGTVALNVTALASSTAKGFLSVYPDGTTRPSTSNLNFSPGQVIPNLVFAKVGTDGKVDIYNGGTASVGVLGDVAGVFFPGTATNGYYSPLSSAVRLLDTRSGVGGHTGAIPAGGTVTFHVTGASGIPSSIAGVTLNVTAVSPTKAGTLTAYGTGSTLPSVTTVSFGAASIATAAMDIVTLPSGGSGQVTIKNNSAGTVHILADAFGYWTNGTGSGTFAQRLPAVRDYNASVPAANHVSINIGGSYSAVAVTASVVGPTAAGNLTLYPNTAATRPNVSSVNYVAGVGASNLAIVPLGTDGRIAVYNNSTKATTVTIDVVGFFNQ